MEKEILKLIEDSSRILIITHVNPDGETLGCASALKEFIGEKSDILIQIKDNFNFNKELVTLFNFIVLAMLGLNFTTKVNTLFHPKTRKKIFC